MDTKSQSVTSKVTTTEVQQRCVCGHSQELPIGNPQLKKLVAAFERTHKKCGEKAAKQ